jgi:hypothetical protein
VERLDGQGFDKRLLRKKCVQFEKDYAELLRKFKLDEGEWVRGCFGSGLVRNTTDR